MAGMEASRNGDALADSAGSKAIGLLLAAVIGTIALVWGAEARACDGFFAGALAMGMRTTFLAATHLPEVLRLAALFLAHLGIGYLLCLRGPFRGREILLAFVYAVGSFGVGYGSGLGALLAEQCALHPWA